MSTAQITDILDTVLATWTEDRYTTGAFARNAGGQRCDYDSTHAVCWCLQGVIFRALANIPNSGRIRVWDCLEASSLTLYATDQLVEVNDEEGYQAARTVLEHARARLEV